MLVQKKVSMVSGATQYVSIEEPSVCPLCGKFIKPQELNLKEYQDESNRWHIAVTYLCKACCEPFLAHYRVLSSTSGNKYSTDRQWVEPKRYAKREFDQALISCSPQFDKIYNQARAAEAAGLDEIAGMGYRKAVEFLVKDYLIHESPAEKAVIEKMELGNCIANKVAYENIKTCAQRCAWLGNDQTHYTKRFSELDLAVLKRFIDAAVYWVQMKLVTEEAAALEKR